jgi:hypothetical protein
LGVGGNMRGWWGDFKEESMFFFEKKNQKTFAHWLHGLDNGRCFSLAAKWQKFFGSFFQKRTPSFLNRRKLPIRPQNRQHPRRTT